MPSAEPLDALLAAAVDGDDAALAALVRRTQPAVWRVCLALGSPGETEDLVQETYLRAIGSLPSYRGDAPVLPWLLAIARNVCADHVRRRTRHTRLIARLHLEQFDPPESAVADGTAADDLVRRLDPDRREAFVLTQLSGLSYAEAADIVGCPIGTIRSRVARARTDLMTLVRNAQAL